MYSTFKSPSTILLPSSMGEVGFFGLLMRDKPVYHAALALSQYHQHSTTLKNRDTAGDIALSQDKNEYYILALRELQGIIQRSHKWSGTAGLIQSVQALTFSLYLFFFEIWNEAIDSTSPRESFPGWPYMPKGIQWCHWGVADAFASSGNIGSPNGKCATVSIRRWLGAFDFLKRIGRPDRPLLRKSHHNYASPRIFYMVRYPCLCFYRFKAILGVRSHLNPRRRQNTFRRADGLRKLGYDCYILDLWVRSLEKRFREKLQLKYRRTCQTWRLDWGMSSATVGKDSRPRYVSKRRYLRSHVTFLQAYQNCNY